MSKKNDKCIACGHKCCRGIFIVKELTSNDTTVENYLKYYSGFFDRVKYDDGNMLLFLSRDCAHLEPGIGCRLYDFRPDNCRNYECDKIEGH